MSTMMTIALDPTAFTAGYPLYGVNPRSARVQVGTTDQSQNRNAGGLGIQYADATLNRLVGRGSITVTVNALSVETDQVKRWPQSWKNSMADLVNKSVLVVTDSSGTPMVYADIIAL